MIWYITGKPRSGKTYYAVYKIDEFAKTDRYDHIYSNIGGLKFDQFSNVHKLDFDIFFETYIKVLYDFFKKAKKEHQDYDEVLIEKVKEDGYYKSAFFVDECQEYLANDRAHLKWLFSYQGHLGFDFYFITQALGLVHSRYKYTVETVTNSISSSFKLFNKYGVYQEYASTKMTHADKTNKFRIPFKQEIFDLYRSGDKIKHKSSLVPMLLMIVGLLIAVVSYSYYFMHRYTSDQNNESKGSDNVTTKKNTSTVRPYESDSSDSLLIRVTCVYSMCQSSFFEDLPYPFFRHYRNDLYKVIGFSRNKYSVDIYIVASPQDMKFFENFNKSDLNKPKGVLNNVF